MAQGTRTPDTQAAPLEAAQQIDALGVEQLLLARIKVGLQGQRTLQALIGRRLVHAALDIGASTDASHQGRWWKAQRRLVRRQGGHLHPRRIERRAGSY